MTGVSKTGVVATKEKRAKTHPAGRLSRDEARYWRQFILRTLSKSTKLSAPQLAQVLGTPERTVRRDLSVKEAPPVNPWRSGSRAIQTNDEVERDPTGRLVARPGEEQAEAGTRRLNREEIDELRHTYGKDTRPEVLAFLAKLEEIDQ